MSREIAGIEYQFTAVLNGDLETVIASLKTVRNFHNLVDSDIPAEVDNAVELALKLLEM